MRILLGAFIFSFLLIPKKALAEDLMLAEHKKDCEALNYQSCGLVGMIYASETYDFDYSSAVPYYQKACDGGELQGCWGVAMALQQGRGGLSKDVPRAMSLFEEACEGDILLGCMSLGMAYFLGDGVEVDGTKAYTFAQKACDGGEAAGCALLETISTSMPEAKPKKKPTVKTEKINKLPKLSQECQDKNNNSCYLLAEIYDDTLSKKDVLPYIQYEFEVVEKDAQKAFEFYQKSCELNYGLGCFQTAKYYRDGKIVQQDYNQALIFAEKGCYLKTKEACTILGMLYVQGNGVSQDVKKAMKIYKKSCKKTDEEACVQLATIYKEGKLTKQNISKAEDLYFSACSYGSPEACFETGQVYESKNIYSVAADKYKKACEAEHLPSCSRLGYFYYLERGVEKDDDKALELLNKACDGGEQFGCEKRDELLNNKKQ